MQNIVFSCASASADAIQTRLRRQKMFIRVKNFTEQKFQVHKNWEMGHFSDPGDRYMFLGKIFAKTAKMTLQHFLKRQNRSKTKFGKSR